MSYPSLLQKEQLDATYFKIRIIFSFFYMKKYKKRVADATLPEYL